MTPSQKLKLVIERAVERGYKIPPEIRPQYEVNGWDVNMNWMLYKIIFSPDFAKAFWGEGVTWFCIYCGRLAPTEVTFQEKCKYCGHDAETLSAWVGYQHQLLDQIQQGKDPIEYLYRWIEGGERWS